MALITAFVRWLALAFTALTLAGCAANHLKPEQAGQLQRVGVISLLPDALRYQKIGVTVFNNEAATRPVGSALNDTARQAVAAYLTSRNKTVVQVEVDVAALVQRMRIGAFSFDMPLDRIRPDIEDIARKHRLDGVILVEELFNPDLGTRGIVVHLRGGLGSIELAQLRPNVSITVVDPAAKPLGRRGDHTMRRFDRPGPNGWTYRLEDNLDPATHQYSLERMQALLDDRIKQELADMGL